MIDLSVDQERIEAVAAAIRYEEDGKQLRREMTSGLRAAVEPAIPAIKAGAMSMTSHSNVKPSLRSAVASKVRVSTRLTGSRAGVRVSVGRTPELRGFKHAPKRLNRAKGWRHPVPRRPRKDGSVGEPIWVQQKGVPGFFDRPLEARQDEMRDAVRAAVEEMSARIARRAGRG